LRVCPTSQQGCQRCRYWWVKCDCGSAERRVNGTNLRQGKVLSCGCLHRERLRRMHKEKSNRRATLNAAPLSVQLSEMRHRILHGKRVTRGDVKLLARARAVAIADEVRLGVRREWRGRARLVKPSGFKHLH
jgi:hypothetical protein